MGENIASQQKQSLKRIMAISLSMYRAARASRVSQHPPASKKTNGVAKRRETYLENGEKTSKIIFNIVKAMAKKKQ